MNSYQQVLVEEKQITLIFEDRELLHDQETDRSHSHDKMMRYLHNASNG